MILAGSSLELLAFWLLSNAPFPISDLAPLAAFVAPVVIALPILNHIGESYRRKVWLAHGICPDCGYNLAGNTVGVCPECGGDTEYDVFLPENRDAQGSSKSFPHTL